MQSLVVSGFVPYYWESQGKAELDFLFQNRQGDIIPLEAKSAANVKSKSLMKYVSSYNPPYAIRVSAKNFGFENNIKKNSPVCYILSETLEMAYSINPSALFS